MNRGETWAKVDGFSPLQGLCVVGNNLRLGNLLGNRRTVNLPIVFAYVLTNRLTE